MAFPWHDQGRVVDPASSDFQLTQDQSRAVYDQGKLGLGKVTLQLSNVPYDQGRVVYDPATLSFFVHDQGRLAVSHERLLVEPAFFDPNILVYDQGRVVNDPVNPYQLVHDQGRVTIDNERPLVAGPKTEPPVTPPIVPLGPDEMKGELQADRVRAQRQDVSIHKL